jgi:hypothetical protein
MFNGGFELRPQPVDATLESLGLLAFMVVIRTIIGWTTVLEIRGLRPLRKPRPEEIVNKI